MCHMSHVTTPTLSKTLKLELERLSLELEFLIETSDFLSILHPRCPQKFQDLDTFSSEEQDLLQYLFVAARIAHSSCI